MARITFVGIILAFLAACASRPAKVDPDGPFDGLQQALEQVADSGSLHVLMVHGMLVDSPQDHADLLKPIRDKLRLQLVTMDPWRPLIATPPKVWVDGVEVWPNGEGWQRDAPRYRRLTYVTGSRNVVFYFLDYWYPLVTLKCRYLVGPDTRLIGKGSGKDVNNDDEPDGEDPSDYCEVKKLSEVYPSLSSRAQATNRYLKSTFLEWGFGDAAIAASNFREVLRQAVGEVLEVKHQHALKSAETSGCNEIGSPPKKCVVNVAITRSLGSYVLFDALRQALACSSADGTAPADQRTCPTAENAHNQTVIRTLCELTQVHMLANQIGLLRLSDIGFGRDRTAESTSPIHALLSGCKEHYAARKATAGQRQVVAYHEPSDILTIYATEPPGEIEHNAIINVVKPFARNLFIAVHPRQAHTGQGKVDELMSMLSCGYAPGKKTLCPPAPLKPD